MALSEKELEKIKNRFEKQNKLILKLYRKSGNKSILELLYLKSDDIEQVSKDFGISTEDAAELIRKNKQFSEKKSTENFAGDYEMPVSDNSDFLDASDKGDSKNNEDFDCLKNDFPEKIIEALCFLGDVIQDTSEKICDALDESIERVNNFDFD